MSSLESIYQKMTPAMDSASRAQLPSPPSSIANSPPVQISRDVAHELNNIFTIIRGYADRMLLKHGENPALRPELQLIANNARRAEKVVRAAALASPR